MSLDLLFLGEPSLLYHIKNVGKFLMLEFGFGLHGGIHEVVAMMAHWNNISHASLTLSLPRKCFRRRRRASSTRSVGFHWILAVGVSFKESRSLVCDETS